MYQQPLAIALCAALLGMTACERDRDDVRVEDTAAGVTLGEAEVPRAGGDEQISADLQKRLDEIEARYDKLERRTVDTTKRMEARGGEARTEIEQDLERARTSAKAKLESARKATAKRAREAIDDAEKALDDLDAKLEDHDRT